MLPVIVSVTTTIIVMLSLSPIEYLIIPLFLAIPNTVAVIKTTFTLFPVMRRSSKRIKWLILIEMSTITAFSISAVVVTFVRYLNILN